MLWKSYYHNKECQNKNEKLVEAENLQIAKYIADNDADLVPVDNPASASGIKRNSSTDDAEMNDDEEVQEPANKKNMTVKEDVIMQIEEVLKNNTDLKSKKMKI